MDGENGDIDGTENLYHIFREFPLFENLYLGMQAMNVGMVDLYIQDLESELLALYVEIERTPTMEALLVSAMSQMWVFALYELLRTWKQQARELVDYGDKLSSVDEKQKKELIKEKQTKLAAAAEFTIDKAYYYIEAFKKIEQEPTEIENLKKAIALIEPIFRLIEALRVTLAKHEIPKTKGMIAQAPGYGRIDMSNGSIYWQIIHKDNSATIVSRRSIVEGILDIGRKLKG